MLCKVFADCPGARARVPAVLCLLACLLSNLAPVPNLIVALGAIDRQHHAAVEERGGIWSVVLHHHAPRQPVDHQHALPARLLSALALPGDAHADHVVALPRLDAAELEVTAASSLESGRGLPAPQPSTHVPRPFLISSIAGPTSPRPPPTCAIALVCLRSTSLRI